jgi:hypothetical protein
MIARIITRRLASSYGLFDNLLETPPGLVPQDLLQISRQPKLDSVLLFLMHQLLKVGVQLNDQLPFHDSPSFVFTDH